MLVSVNYENEIGINQYGYQLRMLTLGIQKADGKQLIWRVRKRHHLGPMRLRTT